MAEQTHGNKQIRAHEKYIENLQDIDAYKLLRFAQKNNLFESAPILNEIVKHFLETGILERAYDLE